MLVCFRSYSIFSHVSHKAIEEADFPVYNATLHEVVLNDSSTKIQITGLESYSMHHLQHHFDAHQKERYSDEE